MTTEQIEVRALRKELAEASVDPFAIAALAVARSRQLERRVQELEAMLRR
jgi:hypothetical protein